MSLGWLIVGLLVAVTIAALVEAWMKRGRRRPLSRHAIPDDQRQNAIDRATEIAGESRRGLVGPGWKRNS